jgi:hypothetical protein
MASKYYNPADEAQWLNDLKTTGILMGLLINFGWENVEFKLMVLHDRSAFDPCSSAAIKIPSSGCAWPTFALLRLAGKSAR